MPAVVGSRLPPTPRPTSRMSPRVLPSSLPNKHRTPSPHQVTAANAGTPTPPLALVRWTDLSVCQAHHSTLPSLVARTATVCKGPSRDLAKTAILFAERDTRSREQRM